MEAARIIAGSHHERWNGEGYPRGLKGEQIPIYGRICALADVFDALGQERPYTRAWNQDEIEGYLRENAGTQFDPQLVNAFFRSLPEISRLQNLYRDAAALSRGPIHLMPMPVVPANHGVLQWSDAFSVGVPLIEAMSTTDICLIYSTRSWMCPRAAVRLSIRLRRSRRS
jgi:hypothetical protein